MRAAIKRGHGRGKRDFRRGIAGLASPVALGWALVALPAQASEPEGEAAPPVEAHVRGDARIYDADHFARFAPRTAYDMLVQVPGFSIKQANGERGLGEASENVLIDGKRIANKSGGALRELQRITAAEVLRIEIVDSSSLGIAGLSGQVANVIRAERGGAVGQFQWNPEWRAHYARPFWFRGQVSYSDKAGPVDYTMSVEDDGSRGAFGGPVRIFGPDGLLRENRREVLQTGIDFTKIQAQVAVDGPGSSKGNLTVAITPYWYELTLDQDRRPVIGQPFSRDLTSTNNGYQFDMSGDVDFKLGPGRLKLIGLRHFDDEPIDNYQTTRFTDGSPDSGVLFVRDSLIGETVLRGEYGWKGGRNTWQISLERAYNLLDQEGSLFLLEDDGDYGEIPFPGGSGKVTETRYEAMATFSRALSPKLDLQVDGGAEYSELSRETGEVVTRRFVRPKGSVTLGWRPDKVWDFSLKLRRRVGQINFYDFLAQQDLQVDREDSGNPDLVPPQSWELDVEAGRSLGKWGKTRLALWARQIDDIIDIVPIGEDGETVGNLPRAYQYGARWTGTLEFAALGLSGAKLDTEAVYEDSSVRDPLSGENRPISGNDWYGASAEFRHDIPRSDVAYGFGASTSKSRPRYYLTETQQEWEGPVFMNVFAEHKNVLGMTVRGEVGNVLGARNRQERTVWNGRRLRDPVLFSESADHKIGPIFRLLVKGSF
ncbi:TonB-dependent receptor [Croceicoccus ponticola]|uniref:TonB-dependent receptor n=2 Tax=Croceicoccus ponticola TaxID=2217664 RepID=A0A437GVB5_9SPHN|nr:TonB-dependent receptor [Croceicoccus ponticola]